jgi:hypothetical protein
VRELTAPQAPANVPEPPAVSSPPAVRQTAAREIALRVAAPDAAPVDIHVSQRGGQVHVAVRTPDAALGSSLRQDLGTLVSSLDRAGYRAEVFTPSSLTAHSVAEFRTQSAQQQDASASGERGSSHDPDRHSGGRGNQQQQQQHRQRDHHAAWIEFLEKAA